MINLFVEANNRKIFEREFLPVLDQLKKSHFDHFINFRTRLIRRLFRFEGDEYELVNVDKRLAIFKSAINGNFYVFNY